LDVKDLLYLRTENYIYIGPAYIINGRLLAHKLLIVTKLSFNVTKVSQKTIVRDFTNKTLLLTAAPAVNL